MQPLEKAESDVQSPAAAEDGLMGHKALLWESSVQDDLQNWKSMVWMGEGKWASWLSYFCNSGNVSKKGAKSETGPWLHLQIKKKENQKKLSLCRISYLQIKISTKTCLEKIIALQLNIHINTLCPAVSTAWLLQFPTAPICARPLCTHSVHGCDVHVLHWVQSFPFRNSQC